jgi:Terminase small subunit
MPFDLTSREERFCQQYALHGGTQKAALEAGYTPTWGVHLIQYPKIFLRIQEIRAEVASQGAADRARILDELSAIAYANIADFYDLEAIDPNKPELTVRSLADIPKHLLRCVSNISQIDTASGPKITIKFYDKLAALNAISKIAGYFKETLDVRHTFVLRAPTVERSTQAWVENNRPLGLPNTTLDLQVLPDREQRGDEVLDDDGHEKKA